MKWQCPLDSAIVLRVRQEDEAKSKECSDELADYREDHGHSVLAELHLVKVDSYCNGWIEVTARHWCGDCE